MGLARLGSSRTPVGKFVHTTWCNLNTRCANGKYAHLQTEYKCKSYLNVNIEMTREEFKKFCISQESIIVSLSRPSLDRLDNSRGYSLDNIQIIELADNIRKDKIISNGISNTCSMCGDTKDLKLFVVDNRRFHGRSTICKECDNERRRRKRSTGQ